jgi:xylan 1,4-beta-xylosidase
MWGMPYPTAYLPLYNASVRALKAVHETLRVGGPSTEQTQHVEDLIADTKRLGIPLDFISTHFYPSDPNCTSAEPNDQHNGISGADPDCFSKVLNKARSFASEAGLPFLITEYKDGLQGGNPIEGHANDPGARTGGGHHGDLSYAAAFVMHNVPLLTDLDLWSYWTFTDVFEEGWGMSGAPFHGQFGCMTREGIRKPVWRAFQVQPMGGKHLIICALPYNPPYKPPYK